MKTEAPKKQLNAIKPDAQAFDEIRIFTVPRFKESELSGDEWRISAQIDFMRKGDVICSTQVSRVEVAAGMVYAEMMRAQDNGHGYFAGNGYHCDQEGCKKESSVTYKLKQGYDRHHKDDVYTGALRHFCDQHSNRGDASLDDSMQNYEIV